VKLFPRSTKSAAQADINRVFDNAIAFYPHDHEHELNRTATRLKRISAPILNSLDQLPRYGQAEDQFMLGQLEPHLDVVDLFFDTLTLQTNADVIINEDPISSLISDCKGECQRLASSPLPEDKALQNATDGSLPGQVVGPPSLSKPKRIRNRKAERERREQKLAVQAMQAAETAGKLARIAKNRGGMGTRSTAKVETSVSAEPVLAPPKVDAAPIDATPIDPPPIEAPPVEAPPVEALLVEEEKPDIPAQSTPVQPVEITSVPSRSVDSPAQPTHPSTSQPNLLSDLRPKVALPIQAPKQEPLPSPQTPAPPQPPHIEYTFHHWAPQVNNPPRTMEPQPERHFQPDFQPIFHHPQQQPPFHYSFLPPQALPMYHHSQIPHSNPIYSHQYQQPTAHHQPQWLDPTLFSDTLQQHQPSNAFSIDQSLRPMQQRQMVHHHTYSSSSQALPRNPPIVTPTLPTHLSRYAAPIPSTITHHLPPSSELHPNQFQTAGMAGVPHQHVSITHPVWTPLPHPGSPDRAGVKRKRSEYERQIPVPAVLDSVDKKDEFAHFEQGWVLPEGSRRNRQGPMAPGSTDPTAVLLPSKPPERRVTGPKRPKISLSIPNEPHVNPGENVKGRKFEKRMSKTEKLKLRKLKDKERNQKRRDYAKREKEVHVVVEGMGHSSTAVFLSGQPQSAEAGSAPRATSGAGEEIGAGEQPMQPPLENFLDGESSSLSSLSDSEEDHPPTMAETQTSAPTDGYRTTVSRASTLSPPPPSPPPRMSMRDRRAKYSSSSVPQAQGPPREERAPTTESAQNKEQSGKIQNRSRAVLGGPPEAGSDGKLEGGTLGEGCLTLDDSRTLTLFLHFSMGQARRTPLVSRRNT
jgi:hypothetical protein